MKSEKRIFYRKLWGLILPITIQNLMTALVSASDAFMLGFVNQTSLSAVSLATQVQFVHNLFMLALTIGATTLAAQYWGKGDTDSVEEILAIVPKISMAVSFVFFAAAMFFPRSLMRIFTDDQELIRAGIPYLRIVSASYLFLGFSQIYLCIMKNSGRTARSTVYGSVAVVINIVFNAVFIFGLAGIPAMGIAGAVSGIIILAVTPFLGIFTGGLSARAHSYLENMMYICTYYMVGKSVNATVIAGVFCAGGDTTFGLKCDAVTMWVVLIPIGMIAAFVLKLPVMVVYFIISMDEVIKLPAVYAHYKKYRWVRNLTENTASYNSERGAEIV